MNEVTFFSTYKERQNGKEEEGKEETQEKGREESKEEIISIPVS